MTEHPICWRHQQVRLGQNQAVNVQIFSKPNDGISSSISRSVTPITPMQLREELETYQPMKLQWSFPITSMTSSNRDSDVETLSVHWKQLCEEARPCCTKSLTRLSLTIPSNQSCHPFVLDFLRNVSIPQLTNLELADNFACYDETLNAIATHLPLLEILSLRNRGDLPVTRAFCEAFASTIRSSPYIRQLYLSGVEFACESDWQILREAMRDSATLEEVSFYRLSIAGTITKDDYFSKQVAFDSRFLENRAIALHLGNTLKLAAPYTVQQRLQALLHVRSEKDESQKTALDTAADMIENLASVADRIDFGYAFLRNIVDPAQWAQ
jgi:hypothetical protein